jgi:hypothetical protein
MSQSTTELWSLIKLKIISLSYEPSTGLFSNIIKLFHTQPLKFMAQFFLNMFLFFLIYLKTTTSVEERLLTSIVQMIYEWICSIGALILTVENRRSRRKICPSTTLSTANPTWTSIRVNPGLRCQNPAAVCVLTRSKEVPALLYTAQSFNTVVTARQLNVQNCWTSSRNAATHSGRESCYNSTFQTSYLICIYSLFNDVFSVTNVNWNIWNEKSYYISPLKPKLA